MTDQTIGTNEGTETSETQEKTFTQQEVNDMMARMKSSLQKKLLKPYEDLGDIEELRKLRQVAEEQRQQEELKRGEFDKVIKELADKKDAEIRKRDAEIQEFKVNIPLVNAAAKFRAVNADQVRSLLINKVRLSEEGEVQVVDDKGSVRYNDSGAKYSVEDLVKEFLDANTHFVQPGLSSTNSKSSMTHKTPDFDVTKLNMQDPKDRAKYKEYRKANGLA